jgi:hypothetical protein
MIKQINSGINNIMSFNENCLSVTELETYKYIKAPKEAGAQRLQPKR